MRLYNIYYLCKELIDIFKQARISINNKKNVYEISDLEKYWSAIDTLKNISLFKPIIENFYNIIPIYARNRDKLEISVDVYRNFESLNKNIINQMSVIIDLYESMNLSENPIGIDVKIPQCESLKEYIKYLDEIDFIFTQCPYLLHKDETIKFSSVDVGSQWLNFIVELAAGSAAIFYILNNLALILDKVMILRSHYNSIKQQEESLKIAQNKAELSEKEKEIFNTLKKHYMSEITDALENEISPLEDGDQRGRLEKSLEKLCNLLDKGVEIYASIDTPNDVQVLFPTLNQQEKLPDAILKYIEDKSDN